MSEAAIPPTRSVRVAGFVLVWSLAALAGMTDAIGFIAAGDFISFMSGNTTRLAIAVGDGRYGDVARLAAILLVFVLGNAAGAITVAWTDRRIWPLLVGVGLLLFASAVLVGQQHTALSLMPAVLAMGALNASVETVAGHPVSLTFVTGSLSRFGKGLGYRIAGRGGGSFVLHTIPWFGMLTGAVVGAFMQLYLKDIALFAGAGLAGVLALVTLLMPHAWEAAYIDRSA